MKLASSLYLHLPFCESSCTYCSFTRMKHSQEREDEFVRAVLKEIRLRCEGYEKTELSTLYLGGGTPSCLSSRSLTQIIARILDYWTFADDLEFTIEINPEDQEEELFATYADLGINRASLGLQVASNKILRSLGRLHTTSDFEEATIKLRAAGILNLSYDLILALPEQSFEDVKRSLDYLDTGYFNHLSAYSLSLDQGTRLAQAYQDLDEIMPVEKERGLYSYLLRRAEKAGFSHYEISSFARSGFESRHNLRYWQGGDYLGFGPGAASYFQNYRRTNTSNIRQYLAGDVLALSEEEYIDVKEQEKEMIILSLRLKEGLDLLAFEATFAKKFEQAYEQEIDKLLNSGLCFLSSSHFALTLKGLDLANLAMAEFI